MKIFRKRGIAAGVAGLLLAAFLLGGCGDTDQPAGTKESREAVEIRVGSLKGPTSIGLLPLMEKAGRGETVDSYTFQMAVQADELLPLMVKGDLDIALVPANVAAILYQKTDGGVAVIDINTLGVLYLVSGSDGLESVADLKGKTVYLTGMGTTPEAALRYLLRESGLQEGDCELEFRSEPTEVAALLAENPEACGLLPQPFATAALMQNASLAIVLDLEEAWREAAGGEGGIVTGVTVVRRAFLEEHGEAVAAFLKEHAASAAAVNEDVETAVALTVEMGIVAKEEIASQAIPKCNITCITGEEMKEALEAYLAVLAEFEPGLVGGSLPEEDFYFCEQ